MLQDIDPQQFANMFSKASAPESHRPIKAAVEELKDFSFNDFVADVSQRLVNFAINVAIAILVFYVGKFIIGRIYKIVATILLRRKVDNSLTTFVLSFIKIVLYFILIITVIGILGIETSSFLAIFASAGIAIGMALSGTLQNFAGGVLILLLKPYKVGDYIEAQGYAGTVREIQIFHTIITTYDNKSIIIPNGGLSTSSINNWSREEYRRVGWTVSISYGDSVEAARTAILDMFDKDPRIARENADDTDDDADDTEHHHTHDHTMPRKPGLLRRIFSRRSKVKEALERWNEAQAEEVKRLKPRVVRDPAVVVSEMADSSIQLTARAWVKSADYWTVFYDYNERFYNELPSHGINFPFPQMDVHIKQV